ncbi:DUF4097 family beta strand repeat-containing protein [Rhodohalobacter mucosus]|uniref:DUF4097 domain-containing protein n=1 Tax=Rhodohalobacter mucosus TaxID=2079485 RepID=A0A316TWZ2_9BACT|nr:DUF4097 family beta strand repeat-containing protein [Rhodohalobacter mucosus]PWN07104.1 hypothetical protein DDZ15_07520 [Rhodohalobacter mucosus]
MKNRHSAISRRALLPGLLPVLFITSSLFTAGKLSAQTVLAKTYHTEHAKLTESHDQDEPYMSRFFSIEDNLNLTVYTPNGSVEVAENSSLGGVQVDLYVKREFSFWRGAQSLENYRIIIERINNEVIATVENKDTGSRVRAGDNNQFSFQIQVPERGQINVRTMNGPINIDGVKGKLYIQNHVGDITVSDSDGELKVASTTGNLALNQCRGSIFAKSVTGDISAISSEGELRLRSESGSLKASNTRGTLIAATVSGNIDSSFEKIKVGVSLETVNGNIDLALPTGLGYTISARGMNFDFSSIRSYASEEKSEMMSRYMMIRGGELPVKLSSVSGNVKVTESE